VTMYINVFKCNAWQHVGSTSTMTSGAAAGTPSTHSSNRASCSFTLLQFMSLMARVRCKLQRRLHVNAGMLVSVRWCVTTPVPKHVDVRPGQLPLFSTLRLTLRFGIGNARKERRVCNSRQILAACGLPDGTHLHLLRQALFVIELGRGRRTGRFW
jgi:hypothetical protein